MPLIHAFTNKANGISNVLIQKIKISSPVSPNNSYNTVGIWDTGASATVVSAKVIKNLGLKPSGTAIVNTASERGIQTVTYLIDLFLKADVKISGIVVTVGELLEGFECLIGMDVIRRGDFAVSNFNGQTCVTFRIPSIKQIDFVNEFKKKSPEVSAKKIGRNDPCYCGSGKKYKYCHGRGK